MAVGIHLMKCTYANIRSTVVRTVHLLTYNSLRASRHYMQLRKYISLRPTCTHDASRNEYYVQGDSLPPLAYVDALRGMPKKMDAVQGRGKVHTQFRNFISLIGGVALLMSGCAPLALAETKVEVKTLGVISTSIITPEGYILFTTTDLSLVKRLCAAITDIPDGAVVFGCSKWNFEDKVGDVHDPKGPCLAIAMMGVAPDGENVIEHELRHCREGYFHG